MKRTLFASVFALAGVTGLQAQETEIRVHYAIPTIWADTQQTLADAFMEKHPDIKITIDGPAEGYEVGVQRLLRESVAGTTPDVAYVGLNLWRVLEDRGLASRSTASSAMIRWRRATRRRCSRWAVSRTRNMRWPRRLRRWSCT